MVRPKKILGQHFLKDQNIASKIVDALVLPKGKNFVLEVGPGTGMLTKLLIGRSDVDLHLAEIDRESVAYLKENYPDLTDRIAEGDFLKMNLSEFTGKDIHIIGNFPYNISSQIFFKVL